MDKWIIHGLFIILGLRRSLIRLLSHDDLVSHGGSLLLLVSAAGVTVIDMDRPW